MKPLNNSCRACLFSRSGPPDAAEQTPGESPVAGHASAEMSGKPKAVVLILVGPPGAGKSTFAEELMCRAFGQWHRINQVKTGILSLWTFPCLACSVNQP